MNRALRESYVRYVALLTNPSPDPESLAEFSIPDEALAAYREDVLADLVFHWGGAVQDLFPRTCILLHDLDQPISGFQTFFYSRPRQSLEPFDYFRVKIQLFREFTASLATGLNAEASTRLLETVQLEAEGLLSDYAALHEDPPV